MATEVILPKVDMDMATGRISRWLVAEGATVKQGDPLFEMETDKAAMEVEAPAGGVLGGIAAKEGVDVPVGQPVAFIYAEGEKPTVAPQAAAPAVLAAKVEAPPAQTAATPAAAPTASSVPGALRATPLARRLAREAGVNLAAIAGSGPHGRIVSADIEKAKAAPKPAAAPVAAAPSDADTLKLFAPGSYSEVPHDNMRRTIARRLQESKQHVPHFYVSADCRLDALLKLRADLNAAAPVKDGAPAFKLSINDLVIKAWALALRDVPAANVSWTEAAMLSHAHADIGVAVSVPGGLITPIIRAAENKSLSAISAEMKDLAARAKARKLKPEEYNGGTSAISNLGMFGVKEFAAIVNPPHATILAVGAGQERALSENGKLFSAQAMTVTLSTDHRAVDGALGAEVLAAFKNYIEMPLAMLI
ncbi:MAG: pyruvate dehydrogenase complex dihydrolipoamide acetyltransferase [Alphaproteobacteria bacterium]|nr:pyruvate dehydrogenase complex dihydrolipoamide acetyltransferase [Alphaproteobacteria bacterium]